MSKTIVLSNHKGGVGKTTSTINLGAALAKLGKRVLLIDLDPQANLTQSLRLNNENVSETIYGAIRSRRPLVCLPVAPNLLAVASTLDLSGAEIELSAETGREYILGELLEPYHNKFDFILIDSPPSLGLLTLNALTAADYVLIPLQAEYLATQGLTKLLEVVEKIQRRLNKSLKIGGVFITQFDARKVLNRNVIESVESVYKEYLLDTRIRENVALAEAPAMGFDIYRYNPKSNGAEDYTSLATELLSKL